MPTYINPKGEILQHHKTPFSEAWFPSGEQALKIEPCAIPTLPRMPLDLWNQMISFFSWGFREFNSEVQISGLVNDKGEWMLIPFYQEANGMTTSEIKGAQNDLLWAGLREKGFHDIIFTGHHHCTANAFASGVDTEDEWKNKGAGFHVTIGKMKDQTLDLHTRAKMSVPGAFDEAGKVTRPGRSEMMPFCLLLLVDVPIAREVIYGMPTNLLKSLTDHLLLQNQEGEFPDEWKARVTKPTPASWSPTVKTYGGAGDKNHTLNGAKVTTVQPTTYHFQFILGLVRERLSGKNPSISSGEAWQAQKIHQAITANKAVIIDDLPGLFVERMVNEVTNCLHEFDVQEVWGCFNVPDILRLIHENPDAFRHSGIDIFRGQKGCETVEMEITEMAHDRWFEEFRHIRRSDVEEAIEEELELAADHA